MCICVRICIYMYVYARGSIITDALQGAWCVLCMICQISKKTKLETEFHDVLYCTCFKLSVSNLKKIQNGKF